MRPKGAPEQVLVHDFLIPDLGRVSPYGVYDIAQNEAWVSVGTDHDTAAFAVESIRRWWRGMGQALYPSATRTQLMLEEKLMVLARPFLKDPLAVQAKLCRRMERFIKELFVFVSDPAVPSDNNAAERSLRHLVTSRKISGGTRSGQGTDSKMTLASLFGTWRARGLNPLLECRRLLASPQI